MGSYRTKCFFFSLFEFDTFVFARTCLEEKFESQPKFGGNKYVLVKKPTSVSEEKLSRFDQSGGEVLIKLTSMHPTTNCMALM